MSEETTTSNTNASNSTQPLIRIRSRFPKATPNVAISSGIARIRRLSGHFQPQQLDDHQLNNTAATTSSQSSDLHRTPPMTPHHIHHQIMSPLLIHNENSNSSLTNQPHILTRLQSLTKSPSIPPSPLLRSNDEHVFSNPATPGSQTFRQYLTSGLSSVPMSPAINANSHLFQPPTTPGGSIYNPRFSTEHIMNIIKYKALQKLKKIESENLKEKRKKHQIIRPDSSVSADTTQLDRSKIRMRDLLYYNSRSKTKQTQQQVQQQQQITTNTDEIILEENIQQVTGSLTGQFNEEVSIEYVDESTNGERSLSNDSLESDLSQQQQQQQQQQTSQLMSAPQLKFAEDGTIIINEESLIIKRVEQEPQYEKTIVEESENLDNLNYNSYRKFHHTKKWTKRETAKFYKALSMIGTDFTMIQRLFAHRNRDEIKRKFKREEKLNQALIDRILSTTTKMDLSVFVSESSDDDDDDDDNNNDQTLEDTSNVNNQSGEQPLNESNNKKTKKKTKPKRIKKRAFIESEDESETQQKQEEQLQQQPPSDLIPFKTNLKKSTQFEENLVTRMTSLIECVDTNSDGNIIDTDDLVLDLDNNKIISNNSVLMDINYADTGITTLERTTDLSSQLEQTNQIQQNDNVDEEEEEVIILDLDNNTFITNNNKTIMNINDYNNTNSNENNNIISNNDVLREELSTNGDSNNQQSKSRIVITRLPKST